MNPFEALGEAMQAVGLWVMNLWCRIRGHHWETSYYPEPHNIHVEAWYCERCYKVEYPASVDESSAGGETR